MLLQRRADDLLEELRVTRVQVGRDDRRLHLADERAEHPAQRGVGGNLALQFSDERCQIGDRGGALVRNRGHVRLTDLLVALGDYLRGVVVHTAQDGRIRLHDLQVGEDLRRRRGGGEPIFAFG